MSELERTSYDLALEAKPELRRGAALVVMAQRAREREFVQDIIKRGMAAALEWVQTYAIDDEFLSAEIKSEAARLRGDP